MNKKKITRCILMPFAMLYGAGIGVRNFLFNIGILKSHGFKTPVICIGNLTVGGTGKTPHTEYLIKLLQDQFKVAVLSRGYKRRTRGFYQATSESTAHELGDEPYQIKYKFPDTTVAVCDQRVKGIRNLLKKNNVSIPDVILLDDAYQHRYVKAGMNILLTDYNRLISRDYLLPAGRLREGFGGRSRAHVVVVTKCPKSISGNECKSIEKDLRLQPSQRLFFSTFHYGDLISAFGESKREFTTISKDTKVLLLTGIANPKPLLDLLHNTDAQVSSICYPDHHHFTNIDLKHIDKIFGGMADQGDAIIITTQKDASRLKFCKGISERVQKHMYVIPIEVEILNNEQNSFDKIITDYVRENQ